MKNSEFVEKLEKVDGHREMETFLLDNIDRKLCKVLKINMVGVAVVTVASILSIVFEGDWFEWVFKVCILGMVCLMCYTKALMDCWDMVFEKGFKKIDEGIEELKEKVYKDEN